MANAAVAVAVAKLTIPNKVEHIRERDKLHGKYEELGRKIGELTRRRRELETTIQGDITNITLDDAMEALNAANTEVEVFNQQCQTEQTAINANNQALRELRDRIKFEIAQAEAAKAAADAAAAAAAAQTAAEEAAALQTAKDSLKEYIASLQARIESINENNVNDISAQIKDHANTINQYDADLDTAVSGADEAISQATRDLIDAFKTDTGAEVNSTTPRINTLNEEFGRAKKAIVTGLAERIKSLQAVAVVANVTAKQINDALEADKKNPIDDKNLSEIKGRAAALAAEFGTKATTEFATRKAEIEGKIEEDKASFQEKQKIIEEYQRIMDILESQEVKEKEAAIQENITKAQAAEKAALDIGLSRLVEKLNKNLQFQLANTNLNTSISSLQRVAEKLKPLNIDNLDEKLKDLQKRSADIQPPPIDLAKFQAHIDALKEAKTEYERLLAAQQARAAELSAELEAARSRSPSPEQGQIKPHPPSSQPTGRPRLTTSQPSSTDAAESSVPEPKRTPGRRYSIFIPTPVQKKPPTSRAEAAAAADPDNTEDAIDPTVLEIFVYEDEKESKASLSTGAGAGDRVGAEVGGGFIQRGGEPPPKVAKIIKVKKITPEIQKLFLSFEPPSKTLTPEFLEKIQENKQSTEVVDTPKDIDNEMNKFGTKNDKFIQSDDTSDFLSKLGQKASHQTTIEKLMIFIDTSKNEENKPIRPTQNGKTYQDMYVRLWQFMEYTSGSIAILRSVFDIKDTQMAASLLAATAQGISRRRNDLTWISPQNNTLFNTLFMEFSKCYNKNGNDDGTYSLFLEDQVSRKGAQKYRFMLNWIILIAFHWYYTQKEKSQQYGLIDCGEIIEHLYHTFIGWMEKMDSQTLNNVFKPVSQDAIDYKERVQSLIGSDFKTDGSLKSLISGIRKYLCSYTNKGKREIANPKKTKGPASAKSQALSGSQRLPPPPTEPPSSIASESESESESEPLKTGSAEPEKLFTRTGRPVVPPLKYTVIPSPQSGPLTDRPTETGFRSNFNLPEAIKYGRRNAVGTGIRGPLPPISTGQSQVKRPSSASIIPSSPPTQSPTPPTNEKPSGSGLSITQRLRLGNKYKNDGGHKRTRKHRTPASSTPAPATRRHRDQSSSAHKHTRRRQRLQLRAH